MTHLRSQPSFQEAFDRDPYAKGTAEPVLTPTCAGSNRQDQRSNLTNQTWLTVTLEGSIAFTKKNLGIIFFGGGTGANVVDIELDPVTE